MDTIKIFLNQEQRKMLTTALYKYRNGLGAELKKVQVRNRGDRGVTDLAEERLQRIDMLIELIKIKDHER